MAEKRRWGWRAKLTALVLSLLLALLIGELALRYVLPAPYADVYVKYPMMPKHPVTGDAAAFVPHATVIARYDRDPFDTLPDDHTVVYRLNDWGFRDVRFGSLVERGGPALAVLGDSFTFGEGVRAKDRFTHVMADALPPGVRVFNLGMPGYGSEDEVKLAGSVFPMIRPDAVLVGYCLNDPVSIWDRGYVDAFGFDLVVQRDDEYAASHSPFRLYRLLRRTLRTRRLTRETLKWYQSLYDGPEARWTELRKDLLRIRDAAEGTGARLGLVLFPIFVDLEGDYPFADAHREVTGWCRQNGIPVLDTLPLFLGRETDDLIVHPKDRHPNAAAHALIGKAAAEFVRKELLPDEGK